MNQTNPPQRRLSGEPKPWSPIHWLNSRKVMSWSGLGWSLCLILAMGLLTACRTASNQPTPPVSSMPSEADLQKALALKEGDVIAISFETITNLSSTHKITMDGMISMPMIGAIKAMGKTPTELQANLESLYEPKLQGKESIVVRLTSSTAVVYVSGAVLHPSKVPLDRPLTVLEAVNEVGGPDANRAKLTEVARPRERTAREGGRADARKRNVPRHA